MVPFALSLLILLAGPVLAAPAWAAEAGPGSMRRDAANQVSIGDPPKVAQGYHPTGDWLEELADEVEARPGVIRPEVIGLSLRGQPIWAFHIAEPGVEVERRVLVFAGIHALEWISTETALALVRELVQTPPRGVAVTVIPVLNPDGRRQVEEDLAAGRNAYRRGNHISADLNRDFAHQRQARAIWRHAIPGYYRTTRAKPLTQPESRALDALADRERYDRSASLHAFGGYLYHPWAGDWERPENHADYVAMGRQMEAAQGVRAYRTRQLSRWGFFFRAHGTELDHLHGEYATQSWLFELTRSGADWRRPLHSLRTYFRWYNPVRPGPHVDRGVAALRELIRAPGPPPAGDGSPGR